MKKIALTIIASALLVVSCKKDRTCECTNTTQSIMSTQPGFSYTPGPPNTSSVKYTNIKKNNPVIQECVSSEQTYSYNNSSYDSLGHPQVYVVTEVTKNDCKIK